MNSREEFQLSETLPPGPREKFIEICAAATAAHGSLRAISDRYQELRFEKGRLEAELERLMRGGVDGYSHHETESTVIAQKKPIEALGRELAIVTIERNAAAEQASGMRLLANAVTNYVRSISKTNILVGASIAAEFPQDLWSETEKLRARLAQLREDLQAVEDAPYPSSHVKEIVRAQIERLAEEGRPSVFPAVESGHQVAFAAAYVAPQTVLSIDGRFAGTASGSSETFNSIATLAWLFKDALIEKLEKEIDAVADDAAALDATQRAKKRARLASAIFSLEATEEAMITCAAARGIKIARRPDMDLRAILGLSADMPAPPPR